MVRRGSVMAFPPVLECLRNADGILAFNSAFFFEQTRHRSHGRSLCLDVGSFLRQLYRQAYANRAAVSRRCSDRIPLERDQFAARPERRGQAIDGKGVISIFIEIIIDTRLLFQ
jgi:hypothetical protein